MNESKRRAVKFLQKENKAYEAPALFLVKQGIKERVRVGDNKVLTSPVLYEARMKEAKKLVHELKKPS